MPAGLVSRDGQALPLQSCTVSATIEGFSCSLTVCQLFLNDGDRTADVSFRFAIPDGATCCGFRARLGAGERAWSVAGRLPKPEDAVTAAAAVAAAAAAGEALPTAGAHGQAAAAAPAAALGEDGVVVLEGGDRRLTLAPGDQFTATIDLLCELPAAGDGAVRFAVPPCFLAPDLAAPDSSASLEVDVAFVAPPPLALGPSVPRPTAPSSGDVVHARIGPIRAPRAGCAVVIDAPLSGPAAAAFAFADRDGADLGPAALALSAVPAWPGSNPAGSGLELCFAIDATLGRERLEQAKAAVRLALLSLPRDARFGIVGFAAEPEHCSPHAVPLCEKSLAHADKFLSRLRPPAGVQAPDLWRGLAAAYDESGTSGRHKQRQIILITSQAKLEGSESAVELAAGRAAEARVFPIAVGPPGPLAAALARAGGGYPETVPEGGRIDGAVLRQLGRCTAPALARPAVDWGYPRAAQSPPELPLSFAGDRIQCYAHCGGRPGLPETVRLSGTLQLPGAAAASATPSAASAPPASQEAARDLLAQGQYSDALGLLRFAHGAEDPGVARGAGAGAALSSLPFAIDAPVLRALPGGPAARLAARAAVRESEAAGPQAATKTAALAARTGLGTRAAPYAADDSGVALRIPCVAPATGGRPAGLRRASFLAGGASLVRSFFSRRASAPEATSPGTPAKPEGAVPLQKGSGSPPHVALLRLQGPGGLWALDEALAAALGAAGALPALAAARPKGATCGPGPAAL
eukprot:tig00020902_g14950.t1